jgi:hypothetical protein
LPELSGGQKLQVGFIAVILVVAGFLFFRNSRTLPDQTILVTGPRRYQVGVDPRLPVSARNPADPAKTTMVTTFAVHDGKLEITEYTPESGMKASWVFIPDRHRSEYDFYTDPWQKVNSIRDPYKHTLTYAAYSAANNRPQRLLARAEMDREQLKAEKSVRQVMLDDVTIMETGAKTGADKSDLYQKVLSALDAYRAKPGDPSKDSAKSAAAHKVVELAMDYLAKMESDKIAAVQKYVDGVDAILKPEQKSKLGEISKQLANRNGGRRARSGG